MAAGSASLDLPAANLVQIGQRMAGITLKDTLQQSPGLQKPFTADGQAQQTNNIRDPLVDAIVAFQKH